VRVGLPVLAIVVVGAAAIFLLTQRNGGTVATGQGTGFSPATLAAGDFGTYVGEPQTRGIFQSISRVVCSGNTAVAASSQSGGRVARAQFLISTDAGANWHVARVQTPNGGEPAPGHTGTLLAGGQGSWLSVGPQAVWTSPTGQTWTLQSGSGVTPKEAGDQVWVLTSTSTGFLAAGDGAGGQAVIWTTTNGRTWQRFTPAQLGLAGAGERVLNISYAASHGNDTVISGAVQKTSTVTTGGARHTVTTDFSGVWRSANGGKTWTAVTVPVSHGATTAVGGVGGGSTGFVIVRPGNTAAGGTDAVTYVSADGSAWQYAATLGAVGALQPGVVKGSLGGFVIEGETAAGKLVAFVSTDGRTWQSAGTLASAATSAITGATVTPRHMVMVAGSSIGTAVSKQAILALEQAPGNVKPVNLAGIQGATVPQVAVSAISTAANGEQVAVGSANGFPGAWRKPAGGAWTMSRGAGFPVFGRPGLQTLNSVTSGKAGWLAVGGPASGAAQAQHPIVVTSTDGAVWQAVDGENTFAGAGVYAAATAADQAGYVIVGKEVTGGGTFAAAWWSAGVTGWTKAVGLSTTGSSQMLAVTAGRAGFVAVGSRGTSPAAWTSANGRTWRQLVLPMPPTSSSAVLQQVAEDGSKIVATGQETTSAGTVPFAALSTNGGTTWVLTVLKTPNGTATVTALATTGKGFTAVGQFGTPGSEHVIIWSSADGATWKAAAPSGTGLNGPGTQEITGLTATGNTLTGVGFTATQFTEQPTLWTTPAKP
jgi:hypothetical protein